MLDKRIKRNILFLVFPACAGRERSILPPVLWRWVEETMLWFKKRVETEGSAKQAGGYNMTPGDNWLMGFLGWLVLLVWSPRSAIAHLRWESED